MKSPHVTLVQMERLVGLCGIDETALEYCLRSHDPTLCIHDARPEAQTALVAELGPPDGVREHPARNGIEAFSVGRWNAKPGRRFEVTLMTWRDAPAEVTS